MNDRFLRACRRLPVDRPPLWIMRQAGRYLPEYRALRERADFLAVCRTPELAVEASLMPLRRFAFDAAIVFSDILLPLEALGVELAFDPGPRIARPVKRRADIEALAETPGGRALEHAPDAVRLLRRALAGRAPVIGFCGAPFTLAAYLADGGSREGFPAIRALRHGDPEAFRTLLERLGRLAATSLRLQIEAGAQAVQIFDSWAGLLAPGDFREFLLPGVRALVAEARRADVPAIYFAPAAPHLLADRVACGAHVQGVCWRTPLGQARRMLGEAAALQGNLDPAALLAPPDAVRAAARAMLEQAGDELGYIANLGHGILPDTPLAAVEALVETVSATAPRPA